MADLGGRSFARRTGMIALGQGAVKANQLIVAVVLVRLLSNESWSQVAYLLSIYLAAVTLGTLNLQHGMLFFLPRVGRDKGRALVVQTAGLMAASGLIIAIGLTLLAPSISGGRLDVARFVPWLGLAIAFELPSACTPAAFIAIDRLGWAATWDITMTLVLVVAVVTPAAVGAGVAGVVAGLVVSAAIRLAAFVVVSARMFDGPPRGLPKGSLAAQVRYGLPLGITIAASVLNRSVDKWFVAAFDAENVGIYSVAAQEIPLLAVLPYAGGAAVVTLVIDAFRRGDHETARQHWLRQTAAMSLVVVPVSATLIVVAPELMSVVFPADYVTGVLPFQIFTAITLHRVAEYGLVLRAANRNTDLVRAALVLLGSNVVLAGIGASMWGMVGASLGTLVANGIAWLFVLGRMAKVFEVSIGRAFAWSTWSAAMVIALVAGGAASVVGELTTSTDLAAMVVKLAVFAAVFVPAARALRLGRQGASLDTATTTTGAVDRAGASV